VQYFMW